MHYNRDIKWKTQVVPIWQKLSFWKKNVLTQFLIGSSIFHSPWHAHGLWKIEQTIKNCSWWSVEAGATYCLIYIVFRFYCWSFYFLKNIFRFIGHLNLPTQAWINKRSGPQYSNRLNGPTNTTENAWLMKIKITFWYLGVPNWDRNWKKNAFHFLKLLT